MPAMTETDLLEVLMRGEDSRHQFKRDVTNADGVAAELSAFANSGGIAALQPTAVRRLNQLLGNAANQHVRPPIHPLTENVQTAHGLVMVVTVPDGLNSPIRISAREELQRMFQRAGRELGTGIPRALQDWPDIDLIDDVEANRFVVRIQRQIFDTGTPQVTPEVSRLLSIMRGEMRRAEIQTALALKDAKHFRAHYLQPALESGTIEMTAPDRPQSRLQRYRLTHPDSSE